MRDYMFLLLCLTISARFVKSKGRDLDQTLVVLAFYGLGLCQLSTMLLQSDITVEVFRFFDRTFLAQLQQLSLGLRDAVHRICPEYPLQRLTLLGIEMKPNGQCAISSEFRQIMQSDDLTAAASQIADFLRHAYIKRCDIGRHMGDKYAMTRLEWMRLTDSLRRVHVEAFVFHKLDLTSLCDDALSSLLNGPSVASLRVTWCIVRPTLVDDAFLGKCKDKRITSLSVKDNRLVNGQRFQPHASEEALLDFCTRDANIDSAKVDISLSLLPTDNLFLHRFLKRVEGMRLNSPMQCLFISVTEQQQLETFSKYRNRSYKYLFELPTSPLSSDVDRIEYQQLPPFLM